MKNEKKIVYWKKTMHDWKRNELMYKPGRKIWGMGMDKNAYKMKENGTL